MDRWPAFLIRDAGAAAEAKRIEQGMMLCLSKEQDVPPEDQEPRRGPEIHKS